MSICWYCHWGWAKPVADIYRAALQDLDGDGTPLQFGPGHIVWSDENFDLTQWCLDNFDQYRGDYSDAELAIARRSLEQLAALPEEVWNIVPADYDGENPQNYPPTAEVVKI